MEEEYVGYRHGFADRPFPVKKKRAKIFRVSSAEQISRKKLVDELKSGGCAICGEKYCGVLVFHHLDNSLKEANILWLIKHAGGRCA